MQSESGPRCDFDVQSASEFNGFQPNSLRNGTGNFQTRIREFFSRNRKSCQEVKRNSETGRTSKHRAWAAH